jgi:hypothetical protein
VLFELALIGLRPRDLRGHNRHPRLASPGSTTEVETVHPLCSCRRPQEHATASNDLTLSNTGQPTRIPGPMPPAARDRVTAGPEEAVARPPGRLCQAGPQAAVRQAGRRGTRNRQGSEALACPRGRGAALGCPPAESPPIAAGTAIPRDISSDIYALIRIPATRRRRASAGSSLIMGASQRGSYGGCRATEVARGVRWSGRRRQSRTPTRRGTYSRRAGPSGRSDAGCLLPAPPSSPEIPPRGIQRGR